jgi:hypothetical protein
MIDLDHMTTLKRLMLAEKERWLKSRGKAGGTEAEWLAHVAALSREGKFLDAIQQDLTANVLAARTAGSRPRLIDSE